MPISHQFFRNLTGALLSLLAVAPLMADDSEIFISQPNQVGARPNVLFIVDTSGSMASIDRAGQPSRLQIVQNVGTTLINSLQNVNLGLMRYSTNAEGGMVMEPIDDINNNRASVIATLQSFSPGGSTPLSETLYEAALYLKGGAVDFGRTSTPNASVPGSRVGGNTWTYKSPIEFQCQKNYIVYLTDGLPTADNSANIPSRIPAMIGKPACAVDPVPAGHDSGWTPGSGECMDDLAAYLSNPTTDLSSTQNGNQNALTYMIGFGTDVAASVGWLNQAAAAGGTGAAYTAADTASLTDTLEGIFHDIDTRSQTFTTPSISVNSFNRTQTGADLFFSLFKVEDTEHWSGNLKKYHLNGATIVDANGAPAISNGFFASGTTSFWSPVQDGSDITIGGAVSQLDVPANRKLFTYTGGSTNLTAGSNALDWNNAAITDAMLGLVPTPTPVPPPAPLPLNDPQRQTPINWARGYQTLVPASGQNQFMGDPMHGQPAIVTYGGTAAVPDTVVYVPTNDGFLHAIVGKDATGAPGTQGGGQELWAFIPQELLPRLKNLAQITAHDHSYGLDGDVQVLKYDANHDGIVNGPDFVWLIFGMRMGGTHYYALNVTDRYHPILMWNIGPAQLPGVGQTWSPPMVTKVDTGAPSQTNSQKYVLIFGGGYDIGQDTLPNAYRTDSVGNRIFMVDAETGALLWHAGDDGAAELQLAEMNNSIPSRITVIDTNGDQFADRMYVGDMGGRLWRFDIFNGQSGSNLVTGGVIARLGAGVKPPGTALGAAQNRRFYNAPDVALIQRRGANPYYNISIGSGYRGHPLDTVTQEHFYAIRDRQPFSKLAQSYYTTNVVNVDSDFVDITNNPSGTTVPATAAGFKLDFSEMAGRAGEKVLAESTTVNNVILFPSFQPGFTTAQSASNPCFPVNTNRVYAITVDTGKPALDFNDDGIVNNSDLSKDLNQTGIVGQINVGVLSQAIDADHNPNTPPVNTICLAGVEVLSKCVGVQGTVRTFWRRNAN